MKCKFAYFPLAVLVALLSSCGREPVDADAGSGLQPIRLGMSLVKDDAVKGIGPLDKWDAQQDGDVYVYGIARKGEKELTSMTELDFGHLYIPNIAIDAVPSTEDPFVPHGVDVLREGSERYYYEENRRYEFFGYYVDDATVARNGGAPQPVVKTDRIELPLEIDGSQDILAAVTDKAADNTEGLAPARLYSAYAVRRGVVPNLVFEHQLSRFNIYIKSGDKYDGTNDVHLAEKLTVTGIRAKSNTKATLVIANRVCNDDSGQSLGNGLDMGTVSTEAFLDTWLKTSTNRVLHPLCAEDQIHPAKSWTEASYQGGYTSFVGSILVMPGKDKYAFEMGLSQEGEHGVVHEYKNYFTVDFARLLSTEQDPKRSDSAASAPAGEDAVAVAGHQYDVNVVVYGLQEVSVTVSLTPWEEGGSFMVDKDEQTGVSALNILADNITLYPGADYLTSVNPELSIGDVPGVEYEFETADESVATVDDEGNVLGHAPGSTKLLITAVRYKTDAVGSFVLKADGSRILIGQGHKTITVTVEDFPLKDPALAVYLDPEDETTLIPNDGTLRWNVATDGNVFNLKPVFEGGGALTYTLSKQFVQGVPADVLTKTQNEGQFVVVCSLPEGVPGNVPKATADITVSVAAAEGYTASADYVIHVIITNKP